jgi:signal transduction histidine kinase
VVRLAMLAAQKIYCKMSNGPAAVSAFNPELRILVLARVGRDAELLSAALDRHGFPSTVLTSVDDIFREMKLGAAAAIVTEESLNGSGESWPRSLRAQPAWSDLPLIVLTAAGGLSQVAKSPLYRDYGNITLLERPLRSANLLSAVESAVRARLRQYEIRDYIQRQAESQEALRRTEKLAVAGRLAASIAHEINNPLAAITNLLYLVSTAEDLATVRKYTSIAQDELRRVSDIANQTLRFYRSPQAPEQVEAAEILDSALALFRSKLRAQGINVSRDYAPGLTLTVSVGELRQVLVNLVANAIDAMPQGGNLHLRTVPGHHPVKRQPGIRITVADDGKGIPRDAQPRLFEPFFTTKGTTGTGLGLWLTRDILERAGGYIRCRNHSSPHGAVFSMWLPLAPTEHSISAQKTEKPALKTPA